MNSKPLIIDCISDTHGLHKKLQLPGGDLLIHAGDCSSGEELDPVLEFLDWMQGQNYAHRVLVLCFKNPWSNFGVKARIIGDRKLIRIPLIRINLRSYAVVDSTELSR